MKKIKREKKENVFTIKEDVRVNDEVILEAGDRIKVLESQSAEYAPAREAFVYVLQSKRFPEYRTEDDFNKFLDALNSGDRVFLNKVASVVDSAHEDELADIIKNFS